MAHKDKDDPNRIILYNRGSKKIVIHKPDKPTLWSLYCRQQLSLQEIADKYLTTATSVWRWLKEYGIARRDLSDARKLALQRGKIKNLSSYTVDENFFDEWSPEMAWVLGIVAADGCIYTNFGKNVLKITQKDPEILYKIRKLMKSNRKISVAANIYRTTRTPIHILVFERKRIISALSRLGITPRKSLTVKFPDVPKTYVRHFLRGIFDGDGTISSNRVRFDTGSKSFAFSLKEMIDRIVSDLVDLPYDACTIYSRKNRKIYQVDICRKEFIHAFYSFLYKDIPSRIYYSRKKQALYNWIKQKAADPLMGKGGVTGYSMASHGNKCP